VLLILEAVAGDDSPRWRYALAQVSTASLAASLDGKEIWTAEKVSMPNRQDAYTYFGVPADSLTEPKGQNSFPSRKK
jgi:hypothetical protein